MTEIPAASSEAPSPEAKEAAMGVESPVRKRKVKGPLITAFSLVVGIVSWIGIANARLDASVQSALRADSRNAGISLKGRYANYIQFGTLDLDLDSADGKAPVELIRAVFQTAEALRGRGSSFGEIRFCRRGRVIYTMDGGDFSSLGASFGSGENPLYLLRTLPEKLRRPTGGPAFERWDGGILAVFQRQMTDATAFARDWAGE